MEKSTAALTNVKASNRISALAEQVFGDGQGKTGVRLLACWFPLPVCVICDYKNVFFNFWPCSSVAIFLL